MEKCAWCGNYLDKEYFTNGHVEGRYCSRRCVAERVERAEPEIAARTAAAKAEDEREQAAGLGIYDISKCLTELNGGRDKVDEYLREVHGDTEEDDINWIKELISRGIGIDRGPSSEETNLILATKAGSLEIVDALLKAGADPHLTGVGGYTPLMYAALHGHTEIAKLLIHYGAHLNAAEATVGWTALLLTAAKGAGHAGITRILIDAGAQLDQRTKDGWSALMLAKINNYAEIEALLAKHKAKITATELETVGNAREHERIIAEKKSKEALLAKEQERKAAGREVRNQQIGWAAPLLVFGLFIGAVYHWFKRGDIFGLIALILAGIFGFLISLDFKRTPRRFLIISSLGLGSFIFLVLSNVTMGWSSFGLFCVSGGFLAWAFMYDVR